MLLFDEFPYSKCHRRFYTTLGVCSLLSCFFTYFLWNTLKPDPTTSVALVRPLCDVPPLDRAELVEAYPLLSHPRITIIFNVYLFKQWRERWQTTISLYLSQMIVSGLLPLHAKLHVCLNGEVEEDFILAERLIRRLVPNAKVEGFMGNEHEYRGILQAWTYAQEQQLDRDQVIFYFHNKGITYNAISLNLLRIMTNQWRGVLQVFDKHSQINKVGYFSSPAGFVWQNFWWARASYLATVPRPQKTSNRYYYEYWLGHQNVEYATSPALCTARGRRDGKVHFWKILSTTAGFSAPQKSRWSAGAPQPKEAVATPWCGYSSSNDCWDLSINSFSPGFNPNQAQACLTELKEFRR